MFIIGIGDSEFAINCLLIKSLAVFCSNFKAVKFSVNAMSSTNKLMCQYFSLELWAVGT
jgi:hypothetical protein